MSKKSQDAEIAAAVAVRIADAKARLAVRMLALGLRPENGWRVLEELRNTPTGHEFVFRPVHLHDETDVEVTVRIGPDGHPE
jgi:hypothetical protein